MRARLEHLETGGAHPGLLLAYYLPSNEAQDKASLMKRAAGSLSATLDVYRPAYTRWTRATAVAPLSGRADKLVTVHGRMALGLGRESVLETGVAVHHTYGTPLLPGSALKGLAAHYCAQVWGAADAGFAGATRRPKQAAGEYYRVLFGETEDAGHITFLDGWITPESVAGSLAPDVMTPHHSTYNMDGSAPPSDFDDPVPVPFLSVRGTFRLVLECDDKSPEGDKWASRALEALADALKHWGLGGKTSSGYGRMEARRDG